MTDEPEKHKVDPETILISLTCPCPSCHGLGLVVTDDFDVPGGVCTHCLGAKQVVIEIGLKQLKVLLNKVGD